MLEFGYAYILNLAATLQPTRTEVEQSALPAKASNQQLIWEQLQDLNAQVKQLEQSVLQLRKALSTEEQKSATLEMQCKTLHSLLSIEQEKSKTLETKCSSLELLLKDKLELIEMRCSSQEERLKRVEDTYTLEELWSISRDEIELTNNILGTGGWGYVKEATFRGRRVAAKCLHEAIISSHNLELFAKEMKISARCRHKNLIEFIGAVPDHPTIILLEIMDYTLRFALTNGTVTGTHHIHLICIHVAEGLTYLHDMRLIHRDVSAPNVLLKAVGTGWIAKLSDLGSAQFANVAQTLAPGCVLYAAPEVQQRDRALKQTEKIDVYSYGILLIEIFTRKMPIGILSQLVNSLQPTAPQFIPLVQQCTNTDPAGRPTMKEVITSLNKII